MHIHICLLINASIYYYYNERLSLCVYTRRTAYHLWSNLNDQINNWFASVQLNCTCAKACTAKKNWNCWRNSAGTKGEENRKKSTNKMDKQIKMFTKNAPKLFMVGIQRKWFKRKDQTISTYSSCVRQFAPARCVCPGCEMANMLLLHCLYLLCCVLFATILCLYQRMCLQL